MPHDHLVRNKPSETIKNGFYIVKLKLYICLFLDKNGPGNNVWITIEVENKPS